MNRRAWTLSQKFEIAVWATVLVVFGTASFYYAGGYSVFRYGTAAWPGAILVLMALALIGQIWDYRLAKPSADARDNGTEARRKVLALSRLKNMDVPATLRVMGAFGIPLLYVLMLSGVGYYALTPFFIAAYLVNAGEKRIAPILATTVGVYVVLTVIFTRFLYVGLPLGNWPGFHAVGSFVSGILSQ